MRHAQASQDGGYLHTTVLAAETAILRFDVGAPVPEVGLSTGSHGTLGSDRGGGVVDVAADAVMVVILIVKVDNSHGML